MSGNENTFLLVSGTSIGNDVEVRVLSCALGFLSVRRFWVSVSPTKVPQNSSENWALFRCFAVAYIPAGCAEWLDLNGHRWGVCDRWGVIKRFESLFF